MSEHEKSDQKTFYLNGITWLPHYKHEGLWVSPANKIGMIAADLLALGATKTTHHLWTRSYDEKAEAQNVN